MLGFLKKKREQGRQDDNQIFAVSAHLKYMGYDPTPYGSGVSLYIHRSGYNEVETAAYIALTTMALDIKEAGHSSIIGIHIFFHARTLLEILKDYKEKGMIHPTEWQGLSTAFFRLATPDAQQNEWVERILSDPVTGKERLARSRINYTGAPSD